jgi:hypothetical protein
VSKSKRPKILPSPVVPKPIVEPNGIEWGKLLIALVTAVAAFIGGQVAPNVLPHVPVDPIAVVAVAPPEAWIPTDGSGKRIECVALESLASTLTDGAYTLTGVPKAGEAWQTRSVVLSTSGVVPPKPVPVVPPKPDVVVLETKGTREMVILRESADQSAELARSLTALRVGSNAEYLKAKGHDLIVLDDDATLADGTPDPYVQGLLSLRGSVALPCVYLIDKAANKLIDVKPFTNDAAAMEALKASGG